MKSTILEYGLVIFVVLALVHLSEYSLLSANISSEMYAGIVGLAFLVLGTFVGFKLRRERRAGQATAANGETAPPPQKSKDELGISNREYEVLEHIAKGYTNQEIADRLFISLPTVKTHTANLYAKLEVRRRTQAVSKAREIGIL